MTPTNSIAGNEGLLDGITNLFNFSGENTLKGITSGSVLKGISTGATEMNRLVSKAIGANDHLIQSYLSHVNKLKSEETELSKTLVQQLTADGDIDHLTQDLQTLAKTLTILTKHHSDIEAHLNQRLTVMKKISGLKETESILGELNKLDDIPVPKVNFGKKIENGTESSNLPGGKVFVNTVTDSSKYSMNDAGVDVSNNEHTFTVSELKSYLTRLREINSQYKSLTHTVKRYVDYVGKWTDVVKSVQTQLDKLDDLSSTVKSRINSELTLETDYLNFYTVFLPRVTGYVNNYVVTGTKLADQLL